LKSFTAGLRITGLPPGCATKQRGGVVLHLVDACDAAQPLQPPRSARTLVLLSFTEYRSEQDLYRATSEVSGSAGSRQKKSEYTGFQPLTSLQLCHTED
jgi:hypothetical protein